MTRSRAVVSWLSCLAKDGWAMTPSATATAWRELLGVLTAPSLSCVVTFDYNFDLTHGYSKSIFLRANAVPGRRVAAGRS